MLHSLLKGLCVKYKRVIQQPVNRNSLRTESYDLNHKFELISNSYKRKPILRKFAVSLLIACLFSEDDINLLSMFNAIHITFCAEDSTQLSTSNTGF